MKSRWLKFAKPDPTEFIQVFHSPTGRRYVRINCPIEEGVDNWHQLDGSPEDQMALIRLFVAEEKRRAGIEVPIEC